MKLYYVVEKGRNVFPPVQTYQSCLEGALEFDSDAPGSAAGDGWDRLPQQLRDGLLASEDARFLRGLLSSFFVDETSAKAAAKTRLEEWNARLEKHNKAHPDDRRPLYDMDGDDLAVLSFAVPDGWTPERAAVKPVPQPRSCANCALRMVEHDLERRTQLGCFVHPDDRIYNAGARICECWTGRN